MTHAPDAGDLLDLCDRLQGVSGVDRALTVLSRFSGDDEAAPWETQALGYRDRRVLSIYRAVYGDDIRGVAHCGSCRAAMEVTMRADTADALMTGRHVGFSGWLEYASDGFTCQYRLPDSIDQRAVEAVSDARDARQTLIACCLRDPRRNDIPIDLNEIDAKELQGVGDAIDKADPGAVVTLTVSCAACGAGNAIIFDSAEFLWRALQSDGRALLYEIHALARAYGWREGDVLALSPRRRKAYVAMVMS